MTNDPFSKCHPTVNFLYFLGVIGCGVLIQHPAYLAAGVLCGGLYYLLLNGRGGWRRILGLLPLFVLLAAINPLFNTQGQRILFRIFGRPYTLEALLYGGAIGAMFVSMMLWFGCYDRVLTGDKFTSLFGNLIPAISLLLVMVFRLVPHFIRKTRQIVGARRSIGKGVGEAASGADKLKHGLVVLGALTSWALEGSVVTGDSMRARGYGSARRSSFMIYRMTWADYALLAAMMGLLGLVIGFAAGGSAAAQFTPSLKIAPVSGFRALGLGAYWAYLLIPTVLYVKEAIQWHISRLKI
ncbi:MAG: energy-coupling factor transporter transmembrane protein EcfT [Oscillospiraceae bacterium]|nr:energy-coupling factor transporter transmembrane protein EcfT [Oscillospiraceae bacterium]